MANITLGWVSIAWRIAWIGEAEGADMNVVIPAILLHDADLLEKIGKIGILQGLRSVVEFGDSGLQKFKAYKGSMRLSSNRPP